MYSITECGCDSKGVKEVNGQPNLECNPASGDCECKDNFTGKQCDSCKDDYFGANCDSEW